MLAEIFGLIMHESFLGFSELLIQLVALLKMNEMQKEKMRKDWSPYLMNTILKLFSDFWKNAADIKVYILWHMAF